MTDNPYLTEAYYAIKGGQDSPHSALVEQMDLIIRARYPLLYIVAVEEEPVEEVLSLRRWQRPGSARFSGDALSSSKGISLFNYELRITNYEFFNNPD